MKQTEDCQAKPGLQMNTFVALLVGSLIGVAVVPAAAQVWRCEGAGGIVFSDTPCSRTGRQLDSRILNGNTLKAEPVPLRLSDSDRQDRDLPGELDGEGMRTSSSVVSGGPRDGVRNACPSIQELHNLEVKASSITLGKKEKEFLHDELRRSRQCRTGLGNYSEADWRVSRDAQDDQNSLTNRQAGRTRSEGMHSAADPIEGDRIAKRRLQQDALAKSEELARKERAAIAAQQSLRLDRPTVSSCDALGAARVESATSATRAKALFGGRMATAGLCRTKWHAIDAAAGLTSCLRRNG